MKMLSNSTDDNETARYLASYIIDNVAYDWNGAILHVDSLAKITKEFYETLK